MSQTWSPPLARFEIFPGLDVVVPPAGATSRELMGWVVAEKNGAVEITWESSGATWLYLTAFQNDFISVVDLLSGHALQ